MMSTEKNIAMVKKLVDAYNRGDAEGNVCYTAPGCLLNGEPFGRDADLQRSKMMIAAFPNGAFAMDDIIAEDEKVVLRWRFSGAQQGELMGIPPTDRDVTMAGISIYHFADDQIAEIWEHYDKLGLLQQVGVIPELG